MLGGRRMRDTEVLFCFLFWSNLHKTVNILRLMIRLLMAIDPTLPWSDLIQRGLSLPSISRTSKVNAIGFV